MHWPYGNIMAENPNILYLHNHMLIRQKKFELKIRIFGQNPTLWQYCGYQTQRYLTLPVTILGGFQGAFSVCIILVSLSVILFSCILVSCITSISLSIKYILYGLNTNKTLNLWMYIRVWYIIIIILFDWVKSITVTCMYYKLYDLPWH